MSSGIAEPAVLAYGALDDIDADRDGWDQASWGSCFAAHVVRRAGGTIGRDDDGIRSFPIGDFIVVDGPDELRGMSVGEAAEAALQSDCTFPHFGNLFYRYNSREDLGRLVEALFGSCPTGRGSSHG